METVILLLPIYNGTTYTMRRVTVTADINSNLSEVTAVNLCEKMSNSSILNALSATITIVSTFCNPIHIGTLMSLILAVTPDVEFSQSDLLEYTGGTNWTVTYIQVYDEAEKVWSAHYSVEYVTMHYFVNYYFYDAAKNEYDLQSYQGRYGDRLYSENYYDYELQNRNAAITFEGLHNLPGDRILEVEYRFNDKIVLTHYRWMEYWGYEPM